MILIYYITKYIGIEILNNLLNRGLKRKQIWTNLIIQDFISEKIKHTDINWILGDIYDIKDWYEGTFILINWTAFSSNDRLKLSKYLNSCQIGTFCITITHELNNSNFELMISDSCEISWGVTEYFVYEKMKK